jgi:hypothetical protein
MTSLHPAIDTAVKGRQLSASHLPAERLVDHGLPYLDSSTAFRSLTWIFHSYILKNSLRARTHLESLIP